MRSAARVFEALRVATGQPLDGTVGVGIPGLVDVDRGAVKHAVNLGVTATGCRCGELLAERLGRARGPRERRQRRHPRAPALDDADRPRLPQHRHRPRRRPGARRSAASRRARRRGRDRPRAGRPAGRACASAASAAASRPSPPARRSPRPGRRATYRRRRRCSPPPRPATPPRSPPGTGSPPASPARSGCSAWPSTRPASCSGGGVAQLGEPLRSAVAQALLDQAASSPFLASLDLPGGSGSCPPTTRSPRSARPSSADESRGEQ